MKPYTKDSLLLTEAETGKQVSLPVGHFLLCEQY